LVAELTGVEGVRVVSLLESAQRVAVGEPAIALQTTGEMNARLVPKIVEEFETFEYQNSEHQAQDIRELQREIARLKAIIEMLANSVQALTARQHRAGPDRH